jgi:hypothetical protein
LDSARLRLAQRKISLAFNKECEMERARTPDNDSLCVVLWKLMKDVASKKKIFGQHDGAISRELKTDFVIVSGEGAEQLTILPSISLDLGIAGCNLLIEGCTFFCSLFVFYSKAFATRCICKKPSRIT